MRVLHVIDNLRMGGAQAVLLGLLRHFDVERVTPVVVSVSAASFLRKAIERLGIPVITFKGGALHASFGILRVAKMVRERQIDVIHTHLEAAKIIGVSAAHLAGRPKIVCHEHIRLEMSKHVLKVQVPFARRADVIVGVSEAVTESARSLYGLAESKFVTVHNATDVQGIDAAAWTDIRGELDLPRGSALIGFGGRLVEQKGVVYLLRAMPMVLERHPRARLLIIGDGALRGELEKEARRLGVGESVHFLGARDDMYGLLKALDLYVQPSLWEGLPMVVMEAMGAARPVVATAVDGTPEVVLDGETGILVPPRSPEALADAINEILGSPDRARSMGAAGRTRVERHFSFQSAARRIEDLYCQLLGLPEEGPGCERRTSPRRPGTTAPPQDRVF